MASGAKQQLSLPLQACRILVVDDVQVMRRVIIRWLETELERAVETVEARDGREAVAKFQPMAFDLVTVDLHMPHMGGLELVENIRSVDSHVPIIMVTTDNYKRRVMRALEAGVSDFLIKPIEKQILIQKCQKWLTVC